MELLYRIKQLGDYHAIDLIGVAQISRFKTEIESSGGGTLISDYPSAVSIGIILPKSIVNLLYDREKYENVFQYRTHAYDVINRRLDNYASMVSSMIQQSGYRVMPVPAAERIDSQRICASISHKIAARLAGFGWIGKSCLLIHPEHGPGIRWTTVLTDAPFEENTEIMDNRCGDCNRCVKACPVQAIKGRNYLDHEPRESRLDVAKCEAYFQELESAGKLKVCGMCIYACPYGKAFHA